MGRRDRGKRAEGALEREKRGLTEDRGGDGWKAEDKLSFRQQSKTCAGRKSHFVERGQWTSGLTGRFEGGNQGRGAREGERGSNEWGGEERGKRQWEEKNRG